mmetsp:Transcript_6117/g.19982  ORF Transcript_6117/g.19982 Transcript_6117/m.19982 type:complete len:284 (-) Transcript_6117:179-1030(-)
MVRVVQGKKVLRRRGGRWRCVVAVVAIARATLSRQNHRRVRRVTETTSICPSTPYSNILALLLVVVGVLSLRPPCPSQTASSSTPTRWALPPPTPPPGLPLNYLASLSRPVRSHLLLPPRPFPRPCLLPYRSRRHSLLRNDRLRRCDRPTPSPSKATATATRRARLPPHRCPVHQPLVAPFPQTLNFVGVSARVASARCTWRSIDATLARRQPRPWPSRCSAKTFCCRLTRSATPGPNEIICSPPSTPPSLSSCSGPSSVTGGATWSWSTSTEGSCLACYANR